MRLADSSHTSSQPASSSSSSNGISQLRDQIEYRSLEGSQERPLCSSLNDSLCAYFGDSPGTQPKKLPFGSSPQPLHKNLEASGSYHSEKSFAGVKPFQSVEASTAYLQHKSSNPDDQEMDDQSEERPHRTISY